jgi:hypothetical protein
MNNEKLLNEPLSLREVQAMTITAATELAQRWLTVLPDARDAIAAGCGVTLVITLRPVPGLSLVLIGPGGERREVAWKNYDTVTKH